MNYIIFDLEWNQCGSECEILTEPVCLPGEIIEIGAVKLDDAFKKIDELRLYIKPQYYTKLHRRIVTLTGIRNQALEALANPQDNIFYLNVNEAVMDANGCLDATLTSDGIHLLGNSLSLWENYLKQHAIVLGGQAVSTTASTTYTTAVTQSTETIQ